jgi:L-histidine N-alpha-methyltransferase
MAVIDQSDGARAFLADALAGLSAPQKTLAPKYFYDKAGSLLFDRICELDEYYPTRAEIDLLERSADALAELMGPRAVLVELGSGSSMKTRIVLDRAAGLGRYVPVDISSQHLFDTAKVLSARYPKLEIVPVVADYSAPSGFVLNGALHSREALGRTIVFFPGSSIGNFEPDEAIAFLARARKLAGAGGLVVIGVDLPKDASILEAAYDDALGVTARFNKNLLARMNRELGADFDVGLFDHAAPWQPEPGRIEMRLVSRRAQRVRVADKTFAFAEGEWIVTEHCYKWSPERFGAMARRAGLASEGIFFDSGARVSMHVLRPD